MGYTHYWSIENEVADDAWKRIVEDTRTLVAAFDETTAFEVCEDKGFVLNTEGCESLILTKAPLKFKCCKTFHHPPDRLICAILSVASMASPDIKVSSDARMGSRPDGWPAAARWASRVLGYEVKPPWYRKRPSAWQSVLRMLHLR